MRLKKGKKAFLAGLLFTVLSAFSPSPGSVLAGDDIELPLNFLQDEFKALSKEVGLMISYSPAAPAEPLGLTGFDIGVEASVSKVESDSAFWTKALGGDKPPSYLFIPRVHAQKGLPFGIDVGAIWAKAPGTNIGLVGGELKYAFIKGNTVMPAMALRGHYTTLLGVDDIDLDVYGGDFSISKGIGFVTPYAGIGQVWINSAETSDLPINLKDEKQSATKGFVGVKIRFFLISFVGEASFSSTPSYIGRLNLSF